MTDRNEGLLQSNKRRRFRLEESAITVEEVHLLVRFGNSELRSQARALLSRNGHDVI